MYTVKQVAVHSLRAGVEEGGELGRGSEFVYKRKVRTTTKYNAYMIADAAEK